MKKGFTLIELMIALLIVGIVATLAINIYLPQARKGRRTDGINTLLSIALAEERYRATNNQYGTLNQVWNSVTTTPQGFYTLSTSNISSTTYTLTATGVGAQANDSESGTSCSSLQLIVSNGTTTKSPTACWPQ